MPVDGDLARRGQRDVPRQPLERRRTRRSPTRRASARSSTTTRRRALDRRRDGHRGQHRARSTRSSPSRCRRRAARRSPSTTRPPTARRRAAADYTATGGDRRLRPGPDHGDGHRHGRRRHARRDRRDLLRQPLDRSTRRSPTARASARSPTTTPPTLSIDDVTVTEGNAGTVDATFTVTLSAAERTDGHGRLRDRGRHGHGAGRLRGRQRHADFAAGRDDARPSTVLVNGDTLDEANETFFVNLSNPAQRDDRRRAGRRHDHRRRPAADVSINDVTVTEGDAGTVERDVHGRACAPPAARPSSVDYATADGTATRAGRLRRRRRGTLTFAPARRRRRSPSLVNGDLLDELDETFIVNLSSAVDATIADGQGVGTITDDDPLPALSDQRRHGDRGQRRHRRRDLHGQPERAERPHA